MAAAVAFDAVARQLTEDVPSVLAQAWMERFWQFYFTSISSSHFAILMFSLCDTGSTTEPSGNEIRRWVKGLVWGKDALQAKPPSRRLLIWQHFPMRTCQIHCDKKVDSGTIMVSNQVIRIDIHLHIIGCERLRKTGVSRFFLQVITRPSAARARTAILEYFEANPDAQFPRTLHHCVHVMRQECRSNRKYRTLHNARMDCNGLQTRILFEVTHLPHCIACLDFLDVHDSMKRVE